MRISFLVPAFLLAAAAAAPQPRPLADRPGFKDPDLFTRMPNFYLADAGAFKETPFDYFEFWAPKDGKVGRERIEGRKLAYTYSFNRASGAAAPSGLQIARNYQNAAKRLGGEILYDGPSQRDTYNRTTLRLRKDGKETWVEVMTRATTYYVTMIERQGMQQDVVANADALKGGLAQQGHVEVPGILFDFNKADIKPESKAALDEVVKLLQASPTLRVWVVGHTDNVGASDFNVKLSQARAAAVVKALAGSGIDARRLTPHGNGPFAPVASNASEEGKARNRRVELVAQP